MQTSRHHTGTHCNARIAAGHVAHPLGRFPPQQPPVQESQSPQSSLIVVTLQLGICANNLFAPINNPHEDKHALPTMQHFARWQPPWTRTLPLCSISVGSGG